MFSRQLNKYIFFEASQALKFFIFILPFFFFNFVHGITLTEVYFETSESKYFNQAIEIKNTTPNDINLADYFLKINQKKSPLVFWQDVNANSYNFAENPILQSGKIALILDRGYQQDEIYHSFSIPVFTVTDSSLSAEVFIKEKERIEIIDADDQVVDYFQLHPAPKGVSLERIFENTEALADNITYCHSNHTLGQKNSIADSYTIVDNGEELKILSLDNFPLIIGVPNRLTILAMSSEGKIDYKFNKDINVSLQDNTSSYSFDKKNIADFPLSFLAGGSDYFSFLSFNPTIDFPFVVNENIKIIKTNISLPNSPFYQKMFLSAIFYEEEESMIALYHQDKNTYLDTKMYFYVWNSQHQLLKKIPVLIKGYQENIMVFNLIDTISLPDHNQIFAETPIALNQNGIVALLDRDLKVIDVVHYDYNWFADSKGLLLERKSLEQFAFDNRNWQVKNITSDDSLDLVNEVSFKIINPILKYSKSIGFSWKIKSSFPGEYEIDIYTLSGRRVQGTISGYLHHHELNVKQEINLNADKALVGSYIAVCKFYSQNKEYVIKSPFYIGR